LAEKYANVAIVASRPKILQNKVKNGRIKKSLAGKIWQPYGRRFWTKAAEKTI
jgi:hypothetical protein